MLRAFINATIGFLRLGELTHYSEKSLMRMLGPCGDPQARNLSEILKCLQEVEGVQFEIQPALIAPGATTNRSTWKSDVPTRKILNSEKSPMLRRA